VKAFVTVPRAALAKLADRDTSFALVVEDQATRQRAVRKSIFISGN
jgi:hypothetical protein